MPELRPKFEKAGIVKEIHGDQLFKARSAFERLAKEMDRLIAKEAEGQPLTPVEIRQLDIILNNAMVLQDLMEGRVPEEFEQVEQAA